MFRLANDTIGVVREFTAFYGSLNTAFLALGWTDSFDSIVFAHSNNQ